MRIAYGTGIVEGEYLKDTFTLADSTIKFQQFGYASSGDIPNSGILGVGLIMNGPAYPAIISQLAIQNITNSPAFSLDLGSVDTEEGRSNLTDNEREREANVSRLHNFRWN